MTDRHERASVLMLMPAAVMVVVILGAIAVDSAVVFLAQRQLADAATAAANDAVTVLVDDAALRSGSEYRVDLADAERAIAAWVAVQDLPVTVTDVDVDDDGPAGIRVRLTGTVAYVFARAIPGSPDTTTVTATATAIAAPNP